MSDERIEYSDEAAEAMMHLRPQGQRIGYCKTCKVEVPERKDGQPRKTCHICKAYLRNPQKTQVRSTFGRGGEQAKGNWNGRIQVKQPPR